MVIERNSVSRGWVFSEKVENSFAIFVVVVFFFGIGDPPAFPLLHVVPCMYLQYMCRFFI